MTNRQLNTSRELRLWVGLGIVLLNTFPEVRTFVANEVKEGIKTVQNIWSARKEQ